MGIIYVVAVFMIVVGIVQLAFPDMVRGLDRFSNELEGVETRQGETYEAGRILRGVGFIIFGLICLFLPGMF